MTSAAEAQVDRISPQLYLEHLAAISRRADHALEATSFDGLVVPSGEPPMHFADDQPYPFRAAPGFSLWVPEAAPGSLLVYRPGHRPLLLFRQEADYWHMPPRTPDGGWTAGFELRVVRNAAEARAAVPAGHRWALLGEPVADWEGLGEPSPGRLVAMLDYQRAAKTPFELACLARASARGAVAHRAAHDTWRAGASEFDIHLEFCRAARAREEELPYNSIIACNEHGAVLHYQYLEREAPAQRRSFLIDAGAPSGAYGSDITRSYAASPGAFADLVAAVEATELRLADMVTPGRDYRQIHLEAHRLLGGVLADCGIVNCDATTAVEAGVTRVFFPHGVGHLLGLQVHDVGGLMADESGAERPRPAGHPYLRLTRDLEPGFVVTIEPGIYFIDLLLEEARADLRRTLIDWDCVAALSPYGGVRIEDNVVALPDGPRNLTREAFAAA